jgi:UDP-N-acetylmuramoyl-L-alanyl-D-glutamate--2,6-diaminopimelate ligase
LAEFRSRGGTHAVIDASRQTIAHQHLSGLTFDAAVVTGLGGGSTAGANPFGRSWTCGRQLVDQLKPGGFAVLNADDLSSKALLDQLDIPALTVGLRRPADLTATLLERHPSEQTFLFETGDESHVVRTAMIGDDHVTSCLAAAAVGLVLGVSPNHIVQGLEAVQSVPGRLQRIECGQPFSVYIDRSSNPSALARNLSTLRAVCSGRLHCLLGVDLRVPPLRRAQAGRVLERQADRSVLTGTRLNRKLPLRAAHDALDGFDRPAQAHLMPNRSRALCWTLSQASPGDVVLLAGGRESLGPDNVRLSDEDVARYWLQHVDQSAPCPWTPA